MRSSSWCRKPDSNLGYDSEATVLNRCVTFSDSGLTWEADPRYAELAVAELGGLQATRPQTSPGGAKSSTPLDQEELELDGACQRDWHITVGELEHEAHVRLWTDVAAAHGLGSLQRERRHQTHGDEVLYAAAEREESGGQDQEDPWHSQLRRFDDDASGWKTFDDVV